MKCDICGHEDINSEEHFDLQCTRTEPPMWVTRDARILVVSEIDDGHLTNIFNMIRGKARFNYAIFSEMVKRGLWDADPGVLARYAFKTLGRPASRNGTVLA